jgi:hypothetical protein
MVNSNDELKDLYATSENRLDTILDRSHVDFWRMLRRVKPAALTDPYEIAKFVLDEFGVKLVVTTSDFGAVGYAPEAEIVDEQKYLVFLLKYQN